METYDVILIGSGHNALIAAAYLIPLLSSRE
jgi:phytoene dehydrogenase-like protein